MMNIHITDGAALLDQPLDVAFRKMAELVGLTEWRIRAYPHSRAATSAVMLPWCRSPRPAYWRAKTNSGRVYQVARQVAKLNSLVGLGLTDADAKAMRVAGQTVVAEVEHFLKERDASRPARYRTDLSDHELVTAKLDGIQLDRNRDTVHGRYQRAMAAIEKRFGKYCQPPEVATRQFQKKSGYTGVTKIEMPAWVRKLHAKFPQRHLPAEQQVPKDILRAEAARLVAEYLERGRTIVLLPPGRAWGYDGDGGWQRWSYHPTSRRSGYIIAKRPPAASGANETWPVPYFGEAAWLRGNHPWQRGPKRRPSNRVQYCGPVITGTAIPRAYCSDKPAPQPKPEKALEDALRKGWIIEKPQGENPDDDLDTARFSRAASREPVDDDTPSKLEPILSEDEIEGFGDIVCQT
jgi:hypothetical protein